MASVSGCASAIACSTASMSGSSARPLSSTPALASASFAVGKGLACAFGWRRSSRRFRARRARAGFAPLGEIHVAGKSDEARIAAGAVGDGAQHRPGVGERRADGALAALAEVIVRAAAVDRADARLEADRAAEARRPQDRADHLGAERGRHHAGADRGGRAARRAARRALGIVRVLGLVPRMGGGEFGGRGLADDDGAGFAERMDACGIAVESGPSNIGEPWPVGMSAVSMMSLIAIGMPSIGDSGLPSRQRAVEASAAAIAPSWFNRTKAPMARIELDDALEGILRDRRAAWSCRAQDRPPAPT